MASKDILINLAKDDFEKDEEIISIVSGALEKHINGKNTVRAGLVIATNKKIRFISKRFLKIYKEIIEYNVIEDVEVSEEKLGYRIFLKGKIQSFVIEFGECEDINKFISYINNKK